MSVVEIFYCKHCQSMVVRDWSCESQDNPQGGDGLPAKCPVCKKPSRYHLALRYGM